MPRTPACTLGLALIAVACFTVTAEAALSPPTTGWNALQTGSGNYTDPNGPTPDTTDILGDATHAAGFWSYDGTDFFMRMRLDKAPSNPASTWQFLFDTDADTDIDWVLQLKESGNPMQVELAPASTGGPTFGDVVLGSPSWTGATADHSLFHTTGLTGNLGGASADTWLDVAIPWANFSSITGLTTSSTFRIGLSTSTTHTAINKDYPLALSSTSTVDSGFSVGVVSNPEPSTYALMGLGLLGLAAHVRKKRRRRLPAPGDQSA